ncbi:C-reactive protein-like [Thalassophryne amazonica]|uniref:C-reactive protein-like n=1 Tax=Thalassophryne amazonica TaxID=390379 RepID=UPI0014715A46|nr:C-reactive protein-like [Thalassophryne amazonica]
MAFLLLLLMLTACAAVPQDLSGKMFTFPQQTNTAHARLNTLIEDFGAITVCLRSFTDLRRTHSLFSLATNSTDNGFLIFKTATSDRVDVYARNGVAQFSGQDYLLNTWNSLCATWDSENGLVQLWLNGKPTVRKFVSAGSNISEHTVILGLEQDSCGGLFHSSQSFIDMVCDVHMWNYVLSPYEIHRYSDDLNFTPGNVLNWRSLAFETVGRVLVENKQMICSH